MKRLLLFSILLTTISCVFFSCETKNVASDPKVILAKIKPKAEVFKLSSDSPSMVVGKSGIQIFVVPSILEKENGEPLGGSIEVELIEMSSKKDLVLNNSQTTSEGKLLISGGAYKINMQSDGVNLKIKENRFISVNLPIIDTNSMQFFTGVYDEDNMNWKLEDSLEKEEFCPICNGVCFPRIAELGCEIFHRQHSEHPENCGYCHRKLTEEDYTFIKERNQRLWSLNPAYLEQAREARLSWEKVAVENAKEQIAWKKEYDKYITNVELYKSIQLTQFGYINCDRFLVGNIPLLNLKVSIENENIQSGQVFAVFKDIQSVMSETFVPESLDKLNFRNIPENYDITIIAVSDVDGEAYYGEKKINSSTAKEVSIKLEKSSIEAINKKLDALN